MQNITSMYDTLQLFLHVSVGFLLKVLFLTPPSYAARSTPAQAPHLQDPAGARLHNPQLLVLAGGGQEAAVSVERHA